MREEKNNLQIPVFKKDNQGNLVPNPIFHRPFDKLHSRCIEYPYAASQLGNEKIVLDVGSGKASPLWLSWLKKLNSFHAFELHIADFDYSPVEGLIFTQSDLRNLPYKDSYFDIVFAISVIEHVGLRNPQVDCHKRPIIDEDGDIVAFRELLRVTKPHGCVVMTFPYSRCKSRLILGDQARCYDKDRLARFSEFANVVDISFFEYVELQEQNWRSKAMIFLMGFIKIPFDGVGLKTWKKISQDASSRKNEWHVDQVACGVWKKT